MSRTLIDRLESRTLFAATLANGVLTVTGTDAVDRIVVSHYNPAGFGAGPSDADQIAVTFGDEPSQIFDPKDVRRIVINAGAGDDSVTLFHDSITSRARVSKSSVDAGAGRDTIVLGHRVTPANSVVRGGADFDLVVSANTPAAPRVAADDALLHIAKNGLITLRGTSGNDFLRVSSVDLGDDIAPRLEAHANGLSHHFTIPIRNPRIVIDGGNGNDHITTADVRPNPVALQLPFSATDLPATLIGGNGDDQLFAGPSTTRLLGGRGDDAFYPNAAPAFVDGGPGTDTLYTIESNDDVRSRSIESTVPDPIILP